MNAGGSVNARGTVVVIGGSSGIGLAVARRSLADGATVVIAGRSQPRLDAARAELAQAGPAAARLSAARRLGRPEDIANAVAFLIADDFVTGTVLHAEGAQVLV